MMLHIGFDRFVSLSSVIAVISEKSVKASPENMAFIKRAKKENRFTQVTEGEEKAYVLIEDEAGEQRIIASPISPTTLRARI